MEEIALYVSMKKSKNKLILFKVVKSNSCYLIKSLNGLMQEKGQNQFNDEFDYFP